MSCDYLRNSVPAVAVVAYAVVGVGRLNNGRVRVVQRMLQ